MKKCNIKLFNAQVLSIILIEHVEFFLNRFFIMFNNALNNLHIKNKLQKYVNYSIHIAHTSCNNVDRLYAATTVIWIHVDFGSGRYISVHTGHPTSAPCV